MQLITISRKNDVFCAAYVCFFERLAIGSKNIHRICSISRSISSQGIVLYHIFLFLCIDDNVNNCKDTRDSPKQQQQLQQQQGQKNPVPSMSPPAMNNASY
jgi:hypothetical protein